MKKILLLLFFVTTISYSQIINIPDANFKAKLLSANSGNTIASTQITGVNGTVQFYTSIDTNNNGEIEQSEAILITYLNVSNSSILDLTGIEFFVNLMSLNAAFNQLTLLDLSQSPNLNFLSCYENQLTSLDVTPFNSLSYLNCGSNLLTSLNVTQNPILNNLSCSNNQLAVLDVTQNVNLDQLRCSNNQLTSLNLTQISNLSFLHCSSNQLTVLDVTQNLNLMYLFCSYNNLTSLNVIGNINLLTLSCENNQIGTLNLVNNSSIQDLYCSFNQLTSLFVKNNNALWNAIDYNGNPNLEYICADDADVAMFQMLNVNYTYTNCHVNSYCTFTPGGNFNTITGAIIYDGNGNGCEVTDLPQPNIKIDINDGVSQGSTFTNNSGNYKFYTDTGNFSIMPNMENSSWFTVSPVSATIPFVNNNNNIAIQNFCITPNGIHPDLEIVVAPIVPAQPGFDAVYKIVYKNKGNQTLSQAYGVSFFYNENVMDYVSASVVPTSINSGGLSWSYSNLLPFESRSVLVTFNINAPTDTNPVNIGDELQFTTSILPMAGDESTSDNTFLLNQTVVGAYDPNDITCLEGNVVSPSLIGEFLHYVINFENTGNFEAENIVVKVEVNPAEFDVNSLRLLNTSHNSYIKVTGNIVEFIFENIALSSGGHGNILLKVQTKDNLVAGDLVAKNAKIYFDYNAPIQTNLESTVFQLLANGDFVLDNSVAVFPNPTKDKISITATSNIKGIQVYDVQGRLLETGFYENVSTTVDLSRYNHGIYLLKISTDDGVSIQKVIKE